MPASSLKGVDMGVTEKLAAFVVDTDYESVPEEAVTAAKRAVLDTLAVTIAGCREDASRIIAAYVRELGAAGDAGVVGTGLRTAPPEAALANGTFAHALDYDDVNISMRGHPSAPLLPAVLALGEKTGASAREAIVAFVLGFEVECKVGAAMGGSHYAHGWHPTATLGSLGAAAASAKLLGLDTAATRAALGIASSLAGGTRQNFGTMTKPLHAGVAASNGVRAAMLAHKGFTADADIIEAPLGFLHMFARPDDYDAGKAVASLGQPFDIVRPGIGVKLYPCCYATHRALDAALALRRERGIEPQRIARVTVKVSRGTAMPLIHSRPQTGLEGKFSMEYCLAASLLDGRVSLASFSDQAVQRPQAQDLLRRVDMEEEAESQGEGPILGPATVTVILDDGSEHSQRVDIPKGDPRAPLTWEELAAKYRDCAAGILSHQAIGRSLEIIASLEAAPDIRELMAQVCPMASRQGLS
ncbi:MAG: MmgE/PrpD family protein [Chloroflexota bacterium]|nr:MmgE/PrpD family protein [Chloroflexota bacterium]